MITIISGEVDSGKTTALLATHQLLRGNAEGFAVLKDYQGGRFIGQKVLDLLSGKAVPFSYLEEHLPADQSPYLQCGRFVLLESGLRAADESIRKARLNNAENVFADEFGPLELREQGLWPIYLRLVDGLDFARVDLYLAMRDTCVASCIQKLNLYGHEIVVKQVREGARAHQDKC